MKNINKILDSIKWFPSKEINSTQRIKIVEAIEKEQKEIKDIINILLDSVVSADPNIINDYENSDLIIRDIYNKIKRLQSLTG